MPNKIFFPECSTKNSGSMFIGLYRYFLDDSWRSITREDGRHRLFPSEEGARMAARSVLINSLNPHIGTSSIAAPGGLDILGVRAWLQERSNVKSQIAAVKNRSGKRVVVERRRGR